MDNYKKRMQVMAYLTRKPVTPQDIEIAQSRIQTPVTPAPMQATSGEELATGGIVNREMHAVNPFVGDTDFNQKYKDTLEKKFNKGQINSNKWENLSPQEKAVVASQQYRESKLNERVLKVNLGNEVIDLPKGMRLTHLTKAIEAFEKGYSKLLEWKKNPTSEKWSELFLQGKNVKFSVDLRKYLSNKKILDSVKTLFDTVNIKSKLTDEEIKKINNLDYQLKESVLQKAGAVGGEVMRQKVVDRLNLIKNNEDVLNFIKNQNFSRTNRREISNKIGEILDVNPSIAARTISHLARAFNGNKDYVDFSTTDKDLLKGSKKISDEMKRNYYQDFGGSFKRQDYERSVSEQLGKGPTYMTEIGRQVSKYLPKGYDRDEIKNYASSAKYKTGGYSPFLQGILKNINNPLKRTVDAGVEQAEKLITELDPFDSNYETKRNIIKDVYNKKVDNFLKKANVDLKEGELPVRAFKLSFDSPTETVSRFDELPENVKSNILDTHKNFGYSFEVPKDVMTGEESLKFVKSPEGQSKIRERSERGDRRVLFEALDGQKLYETIRSKAQKYLPGTPLRAGAATADYLMQNYLFNMPAADAAIAASTWIVKNPQAADAMGKTINAALEGKATIEDAKNFIDTLVKNTSLEDLILPPALQRPKTNLPVVEQKESLPKEQEEIPSYSEFQFNKGGRVKLANGTEEPYNPEIPSLGETDPIGILEQRLINSKDINEIMKLLEIIKQAKEEKAVKEKTREEEKAAQKAKGIRYKEDFPSEAAYFAETGKQLLTNPKYFLGKGAKGIVEGTEWLVGQPMKILFNQEGKNWELYHPVAGEKLGINKYIEENIPKGATTGTLGLGEATEIAGTVLDPFLAYGLIKGAVKGAKPKGIPSMEEIDPTRRDILKTGAIMGTGAALYPTAKKIGMFEELTKGTKVAARTLPKVAGMPEWFPSLISKIEKEGVDVIGKEGVKDLVNTKKLEIPVAGKKESETIFMTKYPDGKIEINANMKGGAYGQPFELHYAPPKTDIHVETGQPVKYPGDFSIIEQRPRPDPSDPGRWEFDWELVSKDDAISDLEKIEKTATGKIADPKTAEKRTAQRKNYDNTPYEDISDRYPEPNIPDYWEQ